jgi:hypothetical protein
MFVGVGIPPELVEKKGQIVFYSPDVPLVTRKIEVVGGGRVFDDGAV